MSSFFYDSLSPEDIIDGINSEEEDDEMNREKVVSNVYDKIDRGRTGINHGASMGLPRLENYICGVTQETYTLIVSNSGGGKTSFSLYAYLYKPLMEHLDDDNFKCTYFSLEMSKEDMLTKLLSIYLYEAFGRVLSFNELLSRKKHYTLSDGDRNLVEKAKPWLKKVASKIEFIDTNATADSVYAILKERLEKLGTLKGNEHSKTFIPNNPKLLYLVVIDHIGLLRTRNGRTLKQEIDLLSSYLVYLRNAFRISPLVVQQTNRDNTNQTRLNKGLTKFGLNDSKDTGNTVNDCNIMLGIYDPFKDGHNEYMGYDISILENRFRSCQVIKNRYGECDVQVPLNFFGEINYFTELPPADQITDWEQYTSLPS